MTGLTLSGTCTLIRHGYWCLLQLESESQNFDVEFECYIGEAEQMFSEETMAKLRTSGSVDVSLTISQL